uniref:Uncharacterized protein n=1 Tax=Bombyx mori TaxID=7091 RepID=A0A8R2DMC3_BOMMO|nr:uncharacterized protein LOC105841941 isoform X2 [Bombyx mori]
MLSVDSTTCFLQTFACRHSTRMVAIIILLSCLTLASGEHSGAYSSPQYAKKIFPKKGYDTIALLPRERPPAPFNESRETISRFDANDTTQYGRSTFMESASNFFSGTGGQVITSIAKDFIARSTGSSQVLSLNLTNLVILIVLKALVLAAGFFGAGAWKGGHYYGRSLEDNSNVSYITEDEILLYLSYLAGQQNKDYGCLYLLSCQRPHQAGLYSSGADLLLQGTKLFQGNSVDLEQYENVTYGIKHAADWGERGMNCDTRYRCGK